MENNSNRHHNCQNHSSTQLREAIGTIQSYIDSSVFIDPSFNQVIDENTFKTYFNKKSQEEQGCVNNGSMKSTSSIIVKIIPSSITAKEVPCSKITINEMKRIFNSIKVIITELSFFYNDDLEERRHVPTLLSPSIQENHSYDYNQLRTMIHEILQLLLHSIPNQNNQKDNENTMFDFIFKEILPLFKTNNCSNDRHQHHQEQQSIHKGHKGENIVYFIIEILPMILQQCGSNDYDLDLSIEKELINLIRQCLFPTYTATFTNENDIDNISNNNDLYYAYHSLDYKKSIQSMISLIEYYPFQDSNFILNNIISNLIIPSSKQYILNNGQDGDVDGDGGCTNEMIVAICRVTFIYLQRINKKNIIDRSSKIDDHNSQTKHMKRKVGRNNSSSSNIGNLNNHQNDHDVESLMITTSLQTIRDLIIFYSQHNQKKECESKIIRECIPFLIESSSIAQGYVTMIQSLFVPKDTYVASGLRSMQTMGQYASKYHWTKLDLSAFCIIFFIYKNDSPGEAMKVVIDELCQENIFPFDDLESILNFDFLSSMDADYNRQCHQHIGISTIEGIFNSNILLSSLLKVVLYILLIPLRYPDYPKHEYNNYYFPNVWTKNQPCNPTSSPLSTAPSSSDEAGLIHPIRILLVRLQSFMEKLFVALPSQKKEDLIMSLLHFSSHSTFISTMLNEVVADNITEGKSNSIFQNRKRKVEPSSIYDRRPLPCNLDRFLPKSKSASKYHIRHVYDVALISVTILHNIVCHNLELPGDFAVGVLRGKVIDRLQNLIISRCGHRPACNNIHLASKCDAVTREEILMLNLLIVDEYCSLLVLMSDKEADQERRLEFQEETKLLFHNLLLGSTFPIQFTGLGDIPVKDSLDGKQCHSMNIIIGVILGKSLINSPSFQGENKTNIFQSIIKLMQSSTSTDVDRSDPLLGYWIIKFLLSSCDVLVDMKQRDFGSIGKCNNNHVNSISAIFKHIKKMVSLTGIVKLESEILTDLKFNQEKERHSILMYHKLPSCFREASKQKRNMIFCISSLLSQIKFNDDLGMKTIQWIRYIYVLFDTYLHMGRQLSPKWSADAWINASFQFSDCNRDSWNQSTELSLVAHLNPASSGHSAHQIPQQLLLQHAISLLLSISIMRAVIWNCNIHYQHIESNGTKERLRKLMLLALAKIYDLQNKVENIDWLQLEGEDEGMMLMVSQMFS